MEVGTEMDYLALPVGDDAPVVVNAVVEIPMGSVNKYEYDKSLNLFRLDRKLHSSVHYPGDYGFIPSTTAKAGDPMDVLILTRAPTFPGCVIRVRPIGVLEMADQGITDEKLLAVAIGNPEFAAINNFDEVYHHVLKEIDHFFEIYKELEGKKTETHGWRNAERARALISEAHNAFKAKQKRG